MRPVFLAVGLIFAAPAEAAVLPSCCVSEGGELDIEEPPPIFVGADTRRPNERALQEGAETPVPVDFPFLIVRPVPADEPREPASPAPAPIRVPVPVTVNSPEPVRRDVDIETEPCCGPPAGETDVEEAPPFFIAAKVPPLAETENKTRAEATTSPETMVPAAVRTRIEVSLGAALRQAGVVGVRGLPGSAAGLAAALLLLVMATGMLIFCRRRPRPTSQQGVGKWPMPNLLATAGPDRAPVRQDRLDRSPKQKVVRELEFA